MATVASTMQSWDAVTGGVKRSLRNVVALQITASKAAVVAQSSAGDGFDQLATAANRLTFAVPDLLDSDEVLDGAIVGGDANLDVAWVARASSGASPTVFVQFNNAGANNAQPTNDPVNIVILVARR